MSDVSRFFKQHKTVKENVFYAATKSLCDEDGKPLEWEIRPIPSKENDHLQESSMVNVPVTGKPKQSVNQLKPTLYAKKLIAASVVYPDLLNEELQNSYGVSKAEDLVQAIVDSAGEWNAFLNFINEFNGFTPIQEDIEEAKNS
jgi:hypothetical protein